MSSIIFKTFLTNLSMTLKPCNSFVVLSIHNSGVDYEEFSLNVHFHLSQSNELFVIDTCKIWKIIKFYVATIPPYLICSPITWLSILFLFLRAFKCSFEKNCTEFIILSPNNGCILRRKE